MKSSLSIQQKLTAFRQLLTQHDIDYYLIPSSDAHQNETPPHCWRRRAWISGFTGSAGFCLIGKRDALLWTDGRYFLQAEQELDLTHWQLQRQGTNDPTLSEWLCAQGQSLRIGVDPKLLSIHAVTQQQTQLHAAKHQLIPICDNLVDLIWSYQPALPQKAIHQLDTKYSGRSCEDKIHALRKFLTREKQASIVISALDEIAWLLNLRGEDIDHCPLFISYAIVSMTECHVFLNLETCNNAIKQYCQQNHIHCHAYTSFDSFISSWKEKLCFDSKTSSWHILNSCQTTQAETIASPLPLMKAIKNETECQGMKDAHIADAIALCKFFHWLEQHWQDGVTEISAATKLAELRTAHPLCRGLSFPSISSFAEHSAIIHYQPSSNSNIKITDQHIYLLDSGGQYLNGTTDVTRTIHLGTPTAEQKRHYTLVLKSHLALRHAVFMAGTHGNALDCIARQALWQAGYDYAHGTGHGVGHYLCVHEGPQGISPRIGSAPLQKNMIVSNEPGLYLDGQYGIRIENLLLIEKRSAADSTLGRYKDCYGFTDLTLVPYSHKLIENNMLNASEVSQINTYHRHIYERLNRHCQDDTSLQQWLQNNTCNVTAHP